MMVGQLGDRCGVAGVKGAQELPGLMLELFEIRTDRQAADSHTGLLTAVSFSVRDDASHRE
jgi:hypothetical protein